LSVALLCSLAISVSTAAELTPAAAAAVNQLYPGAIVSGVEQGREEGVRYFEVAVRVGGEVIEIEVTPDGGIGEIETRVAMADLPRDVRDGISRLTNGARITDVERHEVKGFAMGGVFRPVDPPVIMYEVGFERNGVRREVAVGSNGESLLPTDDDGPDDDDD
jgi:hypothetical protein